MDEGGSYTMNPSIGSGVEPSVYFRMPKSNQHILKPLVIKKQL